MMKKIFIMLVCILISYSANAQGTIVSALYENMSGLQQNYHSVWSSSSTDTHTYIAGPSSDNPNTSWAANQMFIAKYKNTDMSLDSAVTFNFNGYPYFVEEVSGELYIGGILYDGKWRGFIYVLNMSYKIVRSYKFNPNILPYDFTIDAAGDIYAIGSRWGQGYDVFIRKFNSSLIPVGTPDLVLAGSGNDYGWDIKQNGSDIYIAGYTKDGFNAYPKNFSGDSYFVARYDKNSAIPTINAQDFIYVGGSGNEFYNDIDIVINGNNLYLGAGTESIDMPNPVNALKGDADAFVSMIDISPGKFEVEAKGDKPDREEIVATLTRAEKVLKAVPGTVTAALPVGKLLGDALIWCGKMGWM
ncbi:MAG: hypothetical protein D3925_15270 [Candidatus Electrothrix sp. AR5]|nr:hypothetical protein [Candidatus Electrothrix sp. AR5]